MQNDQLCIFLMENIWKFTKYCSSNNKIVIAFFIEIINVCMLTTRQVCGRDHILLLLFFFIRVPTYLKKVLWVCASVF